MAKYKVTGTLVNGRRFPAIHTDNRWFALGINLYRGHVWERDESGTWRIIKAVWN